MNTAYDTVLDKVPEGTRTQTPDRATGKPFEVASVGPEGLTVKTSRGGSVRISPFTFDSAVKYLTDHGCRGENWLKASDEMFQMVLNMENDRVRAGSYVLAILAFAGLVDVDGSRPNKVRLRG